MKTDFIIFLVFVFGLLLMQTAQATIWSWENHIGVSQWHVAITEDETGCGASALKTNYVVVSITHNREIADLSDFAHGTMRGIFTGNTLSIPSRTIKDGQGNSKLAQFDVIFTPNCLSFTGKYRWDYSDSYSKCSGSTTLSGTRTDSAYCPTEKTQLSEIVAARAASADKEKRYNDILANEPNNFWANWDMAELKKKQGEYDEYLNYVDKATSNKDIMQGTRVKLKKEAANRLHISDFPTVTSSPILRVEMNELNNWDGGFINKVNVPKEEATNKEKWYMKYWTIRVPDSYKIINDIVGLPEN